MKRLLMSVLLMLGLLAAPAVAGGPVIPKATGPEHAEGNAYWRINHMNLLKHDRDQTMRLGNRDIKASLAACVDCHAVKGDDGEAVSYESEQHFCRTCHDYVSVRVDCFSCHNSQPETPKHTLLRPELPKSNALATYLKEVAE